MNIEKTIELAELKMMMTNFWAVDNNEECLKATIMFLQRIGLNDQQIKQFIEFDQSEWIEDEFIINKEDKENYFSLLQDIRDFGMTEFESD